MTVTLPPRRPLSRQLLLRLLQVLVLMTVAIGLRWLITGEVSLIGLQIFISGLGVGVFACCGLVSDELGRRTPSVWSRYGVLASIVGSVLVVVGVFGFFVLPAVWKAIGASFFIAFAGVRGSLVQAVDVDAGDFGGRVCRRVAVSAIAVTMAMGVWISVHGSGIAGIKLFAGLALVEAGAILSLLIRRSARDARTGTVDDKRTDA